MQAELPPDAVHTGDSPEFTEATMPDALRSRHQTASGRWGVLEILEGRLEFFDLEHDETSRMVDADNPVVIAPEQAHRVQPEGQVRFRLRFYREGGGA